MGWRGDRIHVELPRATVGGLKKAPVEELLRRIASDYAELQQENRDLLRERAETVAAPDEPTEAPPQAATGGTPADIPRQTPIGDAEPGSPTPSVPRRESMSIEQHADPHGGQPSGLELAGAVLAVAQRMARESRESTRAECELMIKKTSARADRMERELERTHAMIAAELTELEELEALRRELREQMRFSLHALLQTLLVERPGDPATLEWHRLPEVTVEHPTVGKRKRKKKPRD